MADDRRRLRRASLIERLRTAEHRQAAAQAHEAEGVRRKFTSLSERTDALARIYAIGEGRLQAIDLRSATLLGAHLRELGETARAQAERARNAADGKIADLATADRRRSRAEDDRRDLQRTLAERRFAVEPALHRRNWHES